MTILRVKFHGPTNSNGARYSVTDLRTGARTTVPHPDGERYPAEYAAKRAAVRFGLDTHLGKASLFRDIDSGPLGFGGQDTHGRYYVVS